MIRINKCPDCMDENIQITYDKKLKHHILTCVSCQKVWIIVREVKISCPECKKENIAYNEHLEEEVCQNCGLVLSCTDEYVAGYYKIVLDWGLIL